jgi:hypothetical protein
VLPERSTIRINLSGLSSQQNIHVDKETKLNKEFNVVTPNRKPVFVRAVLIIFAELYT